MPAVLLVWLVGGVRIGEGERRSHFRSLFLAGIHIAEEEASRRGQPHCCTDGKRLWRDAFLKGAYLLNLLNLVVAPIPTRAVGRILLPPQHMPHDLAVQDKIGVEFLRNLFVFGSIRRVIVWLVVDCQEAGLLVIWGSDAAAGSLRIAFTVVESRSRA